MNRRSVLTVKVCTDRPLLIQAGTPSELKDIHISSPDVNMNYIRSLLFVCIEIVTVEQSAFSSFDFMCVYLYVYSCLYFTTCVFFFFFSGV